MAAATCINVYRDVQASSMYRREERELDPHDRHELSESMPESYRRNSLDSQYKLKRYEFSIVFIFPSFFFVSHRQASRYLSRLFKTLPGCTCTHESRIRWRRLSGVAGNMRGSRKGNTFVYSRCRSCAVHGGQRHTSNELAGWR